MNSSNHTIRTSRLTRPEGVGAIIDVGGESLMVLPLDKWTQRNYGRHLKILHDSTLSKKLNLKIKYLVSGQDLGRNIQGGSIPVIRFPTWFHCRRYGCNNFFTIRTTNRNVRSGPVKEEKKGPVKCPRCKNPATPFRFVIACKNAHIQDVDWVRYVHEGVPGQCTAIALKLVASGKNLGDWGSLVMSCRDCKKSKNLLQLSIKGERCRGKHPWDEAPDRDSKACSERGKLVLRTASNVYYPVVKTAIDVALKESSEITDLKYHIDMLMIEPIRPVNLFKDLIRTIPDDWHRKDQNNEYLDPGVRRAFDLIPEIIKDRKLGYTDKDHSEIVKGLERWGHDYQDRIRKGETDPIRDDDSSTSSHNDDELFNNELTILNNPDRSGSEKRYFEADTYETKPFSFWKVLSSLIPKVTRIHKLREVNALMGFTRISPSDRTEDGGERQDRPPIIKTIVEDKISSWTIGYENFGEGFFIQFDSSTLKNWSNQDFPELDRHLTSIKRIECALHTFSHLLIRQLEYSSGYSAVSLKERLYIPKEGSSSNNPGILIYTASGDSEGALGGLVRQSQAEHLFRNIIDALNNSEWCSADPVCSETESGWDNMTQRAVNMAACHSCCYIPETACINNNLFLNRSILRSLLNHMEI